MAQERSGMGRVKEALRLRLVFGLSYKGIGVACRMSGTTVRAYCERAKTAGIGSFALIEPLSERDLERHLFKHGRVPARSERSKALHERFEQIHSRMLTERSSLIDIWREDAAIDASSYKYSRFAELYSSWRRERELAKISHRKQNIVPVKPEDTAALRRWRRSNDRRKWEIAVALLELANGASISQICRKIERSQKTVESWCRLYEASGICGIILPRRKRRSEIIHMAIEEKRNRLIKLIHESPRAQGVNRASWSLHALCDVYQRTYGEYISTSLVSDYFRSAGYKFKKARKVPTSNDPTYRDKLTKITYTLSHLAPNEKFFSVDEFGPFSVKIQGGRALVPGDYTRTIPQRQKSKGSLICTAALELSTNQVTHFYSSKKNTGEMTRLLWMLIEQYKNESRLFLSWDSASWHMSKRLYSEVEKANSDWFRARNNTPLVEFMPLPVSAQFLNVIESVFSGLARAVIHNSDYQSVDECKEAIDRYFSERNRAFADHPRRAGNKIWGGERVEAVFKEENNCKDPGWR
ncbi:IS630 family transposase [Methylobacterium sp. CM6257]